MSDRSLIPATGRKRGRPPKENKNPDVPLIPKRGRPIKYHLQPNTSSQTVATAEGLFSGHRYGKQPLHDHGPLRPRKENLPRTPLENLTNTPGIHVRTPLLSVANTKEGNPIYTPTQTVTTAEGLLSGHRDGKQPLNDRGSLLQRKASSTKFLNSRNLNAQFQSVQHQNIPDEEDCIDYEYIENCDTEYLVHTGIEDDIAITADTYADFIPEQLYNNSDDDEDDIDEILNTLRTSSPAANNNVSTNSTTNNSVSDTIPIVLDSARNSKDTSLCPEYRSLGGPDIECPHCHARMWNAERVNKRCPKQKPLFSLCCAKGTISLPDYKPTPQYLLDLHSDKSKGPAFRRSIRLYNSMLSFTSIGGNIDNSINKGKGPYVFRLNGINHHRFGSLIPPPGQSPKFCQLYIYDTENEIDNRIKSVCGTVSKLVDPDVLNGLLRMLDENNELVKTFRMARDRYKEDEIIDLKIVMKVSRSTSGRENRIGPSDEVAAIIVGENDNACGKRDIVIDSKSDGLKRISDLHPKMMALQYPLLFPYGEDGFYEGIPFVESPDAPPKKKRTEISQMEYYAFNFMVRTTGGLTMRLGARLYQQYIVDCFSAIEQSRHWYMRCNQQKLRHELYNNLCDIMKQSDTAHPDTVGQGFILPATFVGSARYMQQNFQDSLAVCRKIGWPDLFLTMTCNPYWDEILRMMSLLPVSRPEDCPDILARVFKLKLDQLYDDIKNKNFFGPCKAVMYVVEYQKRGLSHAHMLIWLEESAKKILKGDIDSFISAEIPDKNIDPYGYSAVKMFMIHGPCGLEFDQAPCMKDFKCTRNFPKRYTSQTIFDEFGFPNYKRRKTKNVVHVRNAVLDNQWVVPFNRNLLVQYQCHINLEVCNHGRCMKYLFKYCLKGPDRATLCIRSTNPSGAAPLQNKEKDEIRTYLDGRYVCGPEAAHRIFGFDIHHRSISVERLCFHLPNEKCITFDSKQSISSIVRNAEYRYSKLEAFFLLCQNDDFAKTLTYQELPEFYVWNNTGTFWSRRKKGTHYGRLNTGHYSSGELWYLRMLLPRIRGPRCFVDLRTIDGVVYGTYKEACAALGLLNDDKEWHEALSENEQTAFPKQLRALFIHIIVNCQVSDVLNLWQSHWHFMSDDILHEHRKTTKQSNRMLTDQQLQYYTLAEIEKLLNSIGKSIKNFPPLPMPPQNYLDKHTNRLVVEETSYDVDEMKAEHESLIKHLNKEQREIYDAVLESVHKRDGQLFFVYGSGGCGKTYLWRTLISKLRSHSQIVLPVASSGIAATLLPGGRTAHSRFKIPIKLDESSTCSIRHNSDIAELIKQTRLIIWDEAPMQNRYAFESLDRTLRDIMRSVSDDAYNKPFGGITVLLGGDFRQILPVILRGSRSDIVGASVSRSALWPLCRLFYLKQNMRLTKGKSSSEISRIQSFSRWVLDVGDGTVETIPNKSSDFNSVIRIPDEYCIITDSANTDLLIDKVFPDLPSKFTDIDYLRR